jgi:hypothetical protein
MFGFFVCACAVPPTPISAVEAVSTVRPYLTKLLRFMFFLFVVLLLFCCLVAFSVLRAVCFSQRRANLFAWSNQ